MNELFHLFLECSTQRIVICRAEDACIKTEGKCHSSFTSNVAGVVSRLCFIIVSAAILFCG